MVLRNILFDVAPCECPTPDYPPKIAVLAHSLRRFVAPSDTVRIQGNTDCDPHRPPILGRIISVTHHLKDWHESVPLHPDIVGPPGDEPMILLQLIVTKQQMLELNRNAHWQILSPAILLATRGIDQVSHTNALVWVESALIESIITVFHASDCVDHTFGPVTGQVDTFFTCSNVIFEDNEMRDHEMNIISKDEYQTFGPGSGESNPYFISETEREVEAKVAVNRMSSKLLTKMGKIGGTGTVTAFMPKAVFVTILNKLSSLESTLAPRPRAIDRRNKIQPILHGNLTLESKSLPNRITSITAKTPAELAAVKSCFSRMIGTGLKKRAPTTRDISEGRHQFNLQQADTVHMVDLDLHGLENESNDDWFPNDAVQRHSYFQSMRNYIKFRYDERVREFRLTLKAMAIKIGQCDAEPVIDFLALNGIEWLRDTSEISHPHLRIGRGVALDNDMWVISRVCNDFVTLVNDDDFCISMTVSIQMALNNLLPD